MEAMNVEIISIDTRYESYRLKDKKKEDKLLNSILENGITDPLKSIKKRDHYILLDGFKRFRCAKKLKSTLVPLEILGDDEVPCILKIIHLTQGHRMNMVEEACFLDVLHEKYGLTVTEIAKRLGHSKSWVSLRLGIIAEMGAVVKENIFSGRFPVRSYMYNLRKFTRVNNTKKKDVEKFVTLVSGKDFSTREIEVLARGFFKGGKEVKEQLEKGKINWVLKQFQQKTSQESESLNQLERKILRDLELIQKAMSQISSVIANEPKLESKDFFNMSLLIAEAILKTCPVFMQCLRRFYDQNKYQKNSKGAG